MSAGQEVSREQQGSAERTRAETKLPLEVMREYVAEIADRVEADFKAKYGSLPDLTSERDWIRLSAILNVPVEQQKALKRFGPRPQNKILPKIFHNDIAHPFVRRFLERQNLFEGLESADREIAYNAFAKRSAYNPPRKERNFRITQLEYFRDSPLLDIFCGGLDKAEPILEKMTETFYLPSLKDGVSTLTTEFYNAKDQRPKPMHYVRRIYTKLAALCTELGLKEELPFNITKPPGDAKALEKRLSQMRGFQEQYFEKIGTDAFANAMGHISIHTVGRSRRKCEPETTRVEWLIKKEKSLGLPGDISPFYS